MRTRFSFLLVLAGCDPDPVGRRCDLGAPVEPAEVVLASGSLDCTSRLCLHAGEDDGVAAATSTGMCTAACATDDDCLADSTTPCEGGFACAPVTSVGPFGCEPVCVCRDDLDAALDVAETCALLAEN